MLTDIISNYAIGLQTALTPDNLLWCFVGVFLGTLVGVLPGVGTLATMSMLFPLTYQLGPNTALIMLAGIWYGSAYGGSTAAILLNLPGTPSSSVTALDGYPMAQQGRSGIALLMTAAGSFFGAGFGILLLMIFAQPFAAAALKFGPAEYFSLIVLGLVSASVISDGSAVKGIAMVVLGVLLGMVGTDLYTGDARLTLGLRELTDGVDMIALTMGLFGIAELVSSIRQTPSEEMQKKITFRSMVPTRDDLRRSWGPMVRGSLIGSFVGIMPGVGPSIAAFMSYAVEKKVSKDPSRFGNGAIEGVVAPETANNAADQASFIPTLTLGIPGSAAMAFLLGIMMVHGVTPGQAMIEGRPDFFWGLVMSFWVGNIMLVILNIPMIGLWIRLLQVPYHLMYPAIAMFICIGVYTVNNSVFDVLTVIVFGAAGYGMRLVGLPAAPLMLGFVLGPMLEDEFRRSMLLSHGDFSYFLTSPISAGFLAVTLVMLLWSISSSLRSRRQASAPELTGAAGE